MVRGYGSRRVTRLAGRHTLCARCGARPDSVLSCSCCLAVLAGCAADSGVTATDAQHSDATFDREGRPVRMDSIRRYDVEIGTFTAPIDYTDPSKGNFELNIARHLALKPDERIGSLLVNPGGPGFGGTDFARLRRSQLRPGAARSLRHRRLGPAWHRGERTEDRLHRRLRPLLRIQRHHAGRRRRERQALIDLADGVGRRLRREEPRHLPIRRHQQLGTRHGRHSGGTRRAEDQLLGVQLRQRAGCDVGDAVPRHGSRRGARRCRRPDRRRNGERHCNN